MWGGYAGWRRECKQFSRRATSIFAPKTQAATECDLLSQNRIAFARIMKRTTAALLLSTIVAVSSLHAQAPATDAPDPRVVALVKELQAQQLQLAQNQAAIDARLVVIAEAARTARIFASRSGGGGK
jgi:hypothetical protein